MNSADQYDPPEAIEGPNNGLVEAVAERLWIKRTGYQHSGPGYRHRTFEQQTAQVKESWRAAAREMLEFLFDIGFVGPAGQPDPARFDGLNYSWLYAAHCWEIQDSEGGYVALVNEVPDLELMMAAPAMRGAIRSLLDSLPNEHPIQRTEQVRTLRASLPENRPPVFGKEAA